MNNIASLWQLIERGRKGQNIGSSTGLPKLDKIIGGIQPSRYYLIGAASSAGKSALVLFIMYHMLRNMKKDEPVYFLYFSLELGADVLLAKLMGLYCAEEFGVYLTLNDIMSFESTLSDDNYEYLKEARKWLDSISEHIVILDKGLSASTLYKETMPFVEKFGTIEEIDGRKQYIPNNPKQKLIGIVDHMSLVHATEGRKLKEEMDLVSSYMVTLKRRFMISWFVLMQQNREASSMDRRKMDLMEPGLSDLKDSSSMAQDIKKLHPLSCEKIPWIWRTPQMRTILIQVLQKWSKGSETSTYLLTKWCWRRWSTTSAEHKPIFTRI